MCGLASSLMPGLCHAQVPHYYVTVVNRMDALLGLRAQINEALAASGEGKLSVNDFIVKASALVRDTAFGLLATACTALLACSSPAGECRGSIYLARFAAHDSLHMVQLPRVPVRSNSRYSSRTRS